MITTLPGVHRLADQRQHELWQEAGQRQRTRLFMPSISEARPQPGWVGGHHSAHMLAGWCRLLQHWMYTTSAARA